MADGVNSANAVEQNENYSYVYENRRYVPRKEKIAYILFDVAQTFNIGKYTERFNLDVLHVNLSLVAIVTFVNGIWDVVNDTIIGALVDKTRTRWGKFKPYLVVLAIPATIGTCLYWLQPIFFPNASETDMAKFIVYFALAIIRETGDTFRSISRTGMLSTISPHPVERVKLITMAQLLSFGDRLPEQIMTVFIDLINSRVIKATMKSLYIGMGCSAAILSGAMALYFAVMARERVVQSVQPPDMWKSIKSVFTNRPILTMTISEFLGAFSLSTGMTNYYIDVLGNAAIYMIVGIPGGFVSTPSYAWVPWARRHFSTRTLWVAGSITGDALMFCVFLFGSIGGKVNGLYKKKLPMIIAIMIQETLFMTVYGIRKVIPEEMYNEAMDYCEWKNGYRTEAMTGVAKGLIAKLVNTFGQTLRTWLMVKIGYNQQAEHLGQSDTTKYYLFAMASALPFATSLLSVIPKLFYNLNGKKRELMYAELLARRANAATDAGSGDPEVMKALAQKQLQIEQENKK